MEELAIILVWLGFFAAVFFSWYYYLQARNKERMALIEKNADITEIYKKKEYRFYFPWLKLGMIITGIGFGLLVAIFLIPFMRSQYNTPEEIIISALMLLFGGGSLIISYFIERPKNR